MVGRQSYCDPYYLCTINDNNLWLLKRWLILVLAEYRLRIILAAGRLISPTRMMKKWAAAQFTGASHRSSRVLPSARSRLLSRALPDAPSRPSGRVSLSVRAPSRPSSRVLLSVRAPSHPLSRVLLSVRAPSRASKRTRRILASYFGGIARTCVQEFLQLAKCFNYA